MAGPRPVDSYGLFQRKQGRGALLWFMILVDGISQNRQADNVFYGKAHLHMHRHVYR